MKRPFNPARRALLIGGGVVGAGLVLGVSWQVARRGDAGQGVAAKASDTFRPNAWLRVAHDGAVTVIVAKSEMGQGVSTSLPMLVAEELEVDWTRVAVEQAPTDPEYGFQVTGGSGSVRGGWKPLREAGAAARMMLVSAAAQQWEVPEAECRAELGKVLHDRSRRSLSYGELVEAAARLKVPQKVALKSPKEFRLIGKPMPRLDLDDKLTGRAIFGIDVRLPDMLIATVAHCPVFGGTVAAFDTKKALAVAGVRHVVEIDTGIAVVADDYPAAQAGLAALDIRWNPGANAGVSSESIGAYLLDKAKENGLVAQTEGDARAVLAGAARRIEAVYDLPFQAHATMEPMNCVAWVKDGRAEVWAPTQAPSRAQEAADKYIVPGPVAAWDRLRKRFGTEVRSRTRVHTTQLGGGFGRRLEQDYVAEAVQIALAIDAPVKLIWSREEDLQHDIYRPATHNRLAAALDDNGRLLAWSHKIVGPSINESLWPGSVESGVDWSLVEGATKLPYAIPNVAVDYVMAPTSVPLGFWRSVGHSHNAFAVECFMDEIAAAAGVDPLAFRLRLLADKPRARKALQLAADKAGWHRARAAGRFLGLAFHYSFHSYVAQVAEVSIDRARGLRVHRVVCVIDCGQVVNPDTVKAQMEGGIAFGLSAAIKGEITLADGRVRQSNYHDYPVLRMSEMPQVDTFIVPSEEAPGGIGEPGVPPIAPAVANAVFAATRRRVRRLPIRPGDLLAASAKS